MQRNLILTILGLCLAAPAIRQVKETQFACKNFLSYYNEPRNGGEEVTETSSAARRPSCAKHLYGTSA